MILETLYDDVDNVVRAAIDKIILDIDAALRTPIKDLTDDLKIKYEEYLRCKNKYSKKIEKIQKYENEIIQIKNSPFENYHCYERLDDLHHLRRKIKFIKKFLLEPMPLNPEIETYLNSQP